ncbi:hypothetical protein BJX63DRAFT_406850 [Aspergillus granulosus]|uniref:F-box domain-containing protein n=1 Tax=Aspergillus granulosus TaxID=176169 RepID=A0ABR4H0V8_9EURO
MWLDERNPLWRIRYQFSESDIRDALHNVADALKIDGLRKLSVNDLVAVLISELPNLQHCSLQVGVDDDEVASRAGLRTAAISSLPIKTIDLSLCSTACEARKSYGKVTIIQRAFSLLSLARSLETLNLHRYNGVLSDDRDPIPPLPNLKNLRLTFSWLDKRTLQRLLSSCHSLRTFHYEATTNPERCLINWHDSPLVRTGNIHFSLPDAVKHLSNHCKTLESVHLDLRMRGFRQCTPEPRVASSFQHFTTLNHLFLNLDELHTVYMTPHPSGDQGLLAELLPSTITSLHLAGQITDELPRMKQSLIGLAEAALSSQLPMLEVVRWDENERLGDGFPVRTMFSAAGIDFEYSNWPLSMSTLGEKQIISHPSYFDDGYRVYGIDYIPHHELTLALLQVSPDEEDPDL